MSESDVPASRHHGNRWGRSEQAREAVMEAVDDLLLERGFAALTIEAVAARAGVGKQTIYRWWNSKVDLLFDAFDDEIDEELPPVETGSLAPDCRALLSQLVMFFGKPSNAAMFRALAGQAQHETDTALRFRTEVLGALLGRCRHIFATARGQGTWPRDADTETAAEALVSPLLYRLLITGEPLSDLPIDRIVQAALAGSTPETSQAL